MGYRSHIYRSHIREKWNPNQVTHPIAIHTIGWHALFACDETTTHIDIANRVLHHSMPLSVARGRIHDAFCWLKYSFPRHLCVVGSPGHRFLRRLIAASSPGQWIEIASSVAALDDRYEFIQFDAHEEAFLDDDRDHSQSRVTDFVALTDAAGDAIGRFASQNFEDALENVWLKPNRSRNRWARRCGGDVLAHEITAWQVVIEDVTDMNWYALADELQSDPDDPSTW
jgi:hypothetical protein